MMKAKWILKCTIGFIVMVALATGAVMLLWNAIIPDIFNLPIINIGQALGLLVLSKILFKGGNRFMYGGKFKQHWKNKLENMNPEDREKFRAQWEQRCSKWGQKCNEE